MTKKNRQDSPDDLLTRFETLDEQTPITDDEADHLFASLGIDPDASLQRLLNHVEKVKQRLKHHEYERAREERQAILDRLEQPKEQRSRAEMLARIADLQSQGYQLQAFYKDLKSVPDEDLASLVAELEELCNSEET